LINSLPQLLLIDLTQAFGMNGEFLAGKVEQRFEKVDPFLLREACDFRYLRPARFVGPCGLAAPDRGPVRAGDCLTDWPPFGGRPAFWAI
jgi:hypothetical protein